MPGPGRPWVKGQSGNPAGRRKSHGDRLKEALEARFEPEVMAEKLDKFIEAGSEKCLLHYFDRVLGKPAQAIQISGDAERPLHGLIGVVGRDLDGIEPPAPAALPAPTEGDGAMYTVENDVGWVEVEGDWSRP